MPSAHCTWAANVCWGAVEGVEGLLLRVMHTCHHSVVLSQLLGDPFGILLDEPTSGLDASMALTTCRVLRRLANNGRLVALTIHQPRSAIWQLFDQGVLRPGRRRGIFGPAVWLHTGAAMPCVYLLAT